MKFAPVVGTTGCPPGVPPGGMAQSGPFHLYERCAFLSESDGDVITARLCEWGDLGHVKVARSRGTSAARGRRARGARAVHDTEEGEEGAYGIARACHEGEAGVQLPAHRPPGRRHQQSQAYLETDDATADGAARADANVESVEAVDMEILALLARRRAAVTAAARAPARPAVAAPAAATAAQRE